MILVELLCRLARLLGCGVREAALGCVRIMGSEGEGEALKSALDRNYSFSVCTRAFLNKVLPKPEIKMPPGIDYD